MKLFHKATPVSVCGKLTHIAFIMDGNGRWAKSKGKSRNFGHRKGSEVIEEVLKTCFDAGVKNVTL